MAAVINKQPAPSFDELVGELGHKEAHNPALKPLINSTTQMVLNLVKAGLQPHHNEQETEKIDSHRPQTYPAIISVVYLQTPSQTCA